MKSYDEQISELSKLVESGRLTKEEFEPLKKVLEEEKEIQKETRAKQSAKVGKYSADSDAPMSRVPMEPMSDAEKRALNTKKAPKLGRYSASSNTPMGRVPLKPLDNGPENNTGYKVGGKRSEAPSYEPRESSTQAYFTGVASILIVILIGKLFIMGIIAANEGVFSSSSESETSVVYVEGKRVLSFDELSPEEAEEYKRAISIK